MDSGGVGAGGAATGGTRSRGSLLRGDGARGTGTGGASLRGVGAGGAGTGGASSGGARAGGPGIVGASSEETGAGGTTTAPPHRHVTRLQAARRCEHEEQEPLEQERQDLRQLDLHEQQEQQQLFPPVSGLQALGLPSSSPVRSPSLLAFGPTFPLPDDSLAVCRSPPVSVLPSPPPSSLPISPTPISDYYHAARPVVSHVLATLATDSRFSPSSVSALTAAVAEFAATDRLDYVTHVVPAPPFRPLSVGGEFALGCDVLEDRQFELEYLAAMLLSPKGHPDALDIPTPRTYREAVSGEWASQGKAAMDSELASWISTATYVDAVPHPRANFVNGMWLFKVKWPPGSPTVFKARYVARGFNEHEGVDFFQNFAPTPKMTTLRVLLHVAAHRDYELHSFDFSTAFLQGRLHKEIWLQLPPGFTDTFLPGTQWSLTRPVYGLRQSPREWHDTLRSTLSDLGFRPSSADPSLFVRAGSTPLYWSMLMTWSLLQHPGQLWLRVTQYLAITSGIWFVLGGTQPVELTGHCASSYADDAETQRSTQGYCFSLGAGAVSWRSTRSSSVASSSAEAKIYAGAMAAQELR
ncbi:unnamed protein product [Closterium sp. NIES-54]